MLFCSWSPSASRFGVLCVQVCSSAFFQLLLLSSQLEQSGHSTQTSGYFLFFGPEQLRHIQSLLFELQRVVLITSTHINLFLVNLFGWSVYITFLNCKPWTVIYAGHLPDHTFFRLLDSLKLRQRVFNYWSEDDQRMIKPIKLFKVWKKQNLIPEEQKNPQKVKNIKSVCDAMVTINPSVPGVSDSRAQGVYTSVLVCVSVHVCVCLYVHAAHKRSIRIFWFCGLCMCALVFVLHKQGCCIIASYLHSIVTWQGLTLYAKALTWLLLQKLLPLSVSRWIIHRAPVLLTDSYLGHVLLLLRGQWKVWSLKALKESR